MSVIHIENFSVTFPLQKKASLPPVSFEVATGETVLLLGPSGCGKSTLALALQGLIPRSVEAEVSGSISVNGSDPASWTPREASRQLGILFQDPETQFCMLTVEDEILFGLENLGLSRAEMKERLEKSLRLTGLTGRRQESLNKLSGGLKQKAAIACLLALDPDIFVLDEPTANLDPKSRDDIFELFADIARDPAKTVIFIEHQLDSLLPVIDRVIALRGDGGLLADGDPRDVFRKHHDLFKEEGIWTPQVCTKALKLEQERMITWPELPLSLAEWEAACKEQDVTAPPFSERKTDVRSPADSTPLVEAKQLCFSYKKEDVLKDVDFSIARGEFAALVGANGAGKSTLAKVIAGIRPPTAGTLRRNGRNQRKMKITEVFKQTGYVFQNPEHQFVTDTVEEELAYGWKSTEIPQDQWQQDVEEKLAQFHLTEKRAVNPFALSQGQKRRLSVATMLSHDQELLILDEPTFGQDEANTAALMNIIERLHKNGQTILMITHDMELVARYAEKVLLVDEGTIAYEGSAAAFFEEPALLEKASLKRPVSLELKRWEHALSHRKAVMT